MNPWKPCALLGGLLLSFGPGWSAPEWIWSSATPKDNDAAQFRHEFDVAGDLKSAQLRVSCDNKAAVWLNGQKVAEADDWQAPVSVDARKFLRPGRNEIRILGRNEGGSAGLVAILKMTTQSGGSSTVESSGQWQTSPQGQEAWKPVAVIGKLGMQPWGNVFAGNRSTGSGGTVVDPAELKLLPGFKAELLHTVPKTEQGSWVSMTVDGKGRLICGDQYGALYRVTPAPLGAADPAAETKVEKLTSKIGGAHGLLWAFDSLYVMVNERATPDSKPGLWRLRDADDDGTFEKEEHLSQIDGGGEHGPHSIVLSPDGKSLYLTCGNHTKLPEGLQKSRAAKAWGEDHLLPRSWDANGHAAGILAPGGYVVKCDPDGKNMELFASGFRNEFDASFSAEGELFTYDSDMEWDIGTPWYRPTRMLHVVSGGEYGWRSGSGKWPTYYPDSLPGTADIGPGSPTGTTFGTGAKFPAKYQRAFFGCDWTYGTMYCLHLNPKGGTYEPHVEEFVGGKPLPLTDVVIRPQDGAMYFAVGGRRTQSGLFRITWTGAAEPAAAAVPLTPEMKIRREMESLHTAGPDPSVVARAWPHLGHADRFVRFAARVAIERQPVASWSSQVWEETRPDAVIEACVALARVGGNPGFQVSILEKLATLQPRALSTAQQLAALRAAELALIRYGKPDAATCAAVAESLGSLYPAVDDFVNRELCDLLIFLDSPSVVAKTLQLIATARELEGAEKASAQVLARNEGYASAIAAAGETRPNRQQIALGWSLRNATVGWTPELRRQYFAWFASTKKWRGGNSFSKFIEIARQEALSHVPEAERPAMDTLSRKVEEPTALTFTPAKGPGRAWTIDDVLKLADGRLTKRNHASGKNLYSAAACFTCHRFGGEGGGLGPDLTGSGNRYTLRDLLENIIEPSKVISDQYESTQIDKTDGSVIVGRITSKDADTVSVAMNPLAPTDVVKVPLKDIKAQHPYPISMMPPGLLNALNEEEVLDLLAYLVSAGNPDDKVYK